MEGGESINHKETSSFDIELKNVTFRYPGTDKPIFEKLNLTIPWGEKLAVVGLNGAGKTTLVKLICGLYDRSYRGEVLLNVSQTETGDRQQAWECLEKAGIADKIRSLPQPLMLLRKVIFTTGIRS